MHWRRNWQPNLVFFPGESQEQGSLVGCHLWGSHRVRHDWSGFPAAAPLTSINYLAFHTVSLLHIDTSLLLLLKSASLIFLSPSMWRFTSVLVSSWSWFCGILFLNLVSEHSFNRSQYGQLNNFLSYLLLLFYLLSSYNMLQLPPLLSFYLL